jgi:hypothetical protein
MVANPDGNSTDAKSPQNMPFGCVAGATVWAAGLALAFASGH